MTPKVLLLGLSDEYWTPFISDMARLLRERGIPYVIAVDSRAGEYQVFGRRADSDLNTVYYFTDWLSENPSASTTGPDENIPLRAMFADYFRLTALGAHRQAGRVDWRLLSAQMAMFFRHVIDAEDVSVVVHDQVSTSFSYVCHEVAESRGIPYLGLVGARIPERYEIRRSIYREHEVLAGIYREIVEGRTPLTAEERAWAEAYLRDIDRHEPSYMAGNALTDPTFQRYANRHKLRSFFRKLAYQLREPEEVRLHAFRQPPFVASLRSFRRNMARLYHMRRFHAFARPIDEVWQNSHAFVVYPIHYQPEASTSVGSPHFVNQVDVVRNIAFSLPPGLHLVVKEHRSAIGYNPTSFYREIAALPGVRLVSPYLSIKELLRASEGVVALTSTAAFEALLLGKRAWLFGATPFEFHPLCHRTASFHELEESLRQRQQPAPPYDNKAFLVAYRRYTRPGSIRYEQEAWGIGDDLLKVLLEELAGHKRTFESSAWRPVSAPERTLS